MQDEQINLLEAELRRSLLESVQCFVVSIVGDPNFGLDEDVRAVEAGTAQRLPDPLFVAVGSGSVDVAVSDLEGGLHCFGRFIGRGLEDAEADLGNGDAVVQREMWLCGSHGPVLFLERSTAMQALDRGMAQIFTGRHSCNVSYDETRDRLAPLVDEVAARARNSGQLRADVTGTDLIFIQVALSSVAAVAQDGHQPADRQDTSKLYRRYLWITLDGLRADRDPSPLPVPPLSVDDTHKLLRTEA